MNDDQTFISITGLLALVSIVACRILHKKRRIPHTASFQDDPAGASSDVLILISFLFGATSLVFFIYGIVIPNNYCSKLINTDINKLDVESKEKLIECKKIKELYKFIFH